MAVVVIAVVMMVKGRWRCRHAMTTDFAVMLRHVGALTAKEHREDDGRTRDEGIGEGCGGGCAGGMGTKSDDGGDAMEGRMLNAMAMAVRMM